ncbi:hypothetical protein MJ390_27215 [Klebsiella pneumoniae]|nr:hypothetical protein MJ390_27215 [Klebsiella pneumoniae]
MARRSAGYRSGH